MLRLPAAANNAAWCDFVCRRHGLEPVFTADAWTCPTRTPDLHPDAVTLVPAIDGPGSPPPWDVLHLETVDLCHTGDVVGLTNVATDDWLQLVADIEARCPGEILVGYERGDALIAALAAGFDAIGPLRVWVMP